MHKTIGVDKHKDLPKYSHGTFRSWYKKQAQTQAQFARQVSYFHGCYVNYNHPQLGKDLVKVLNAMGYGVQLLKKEKCCGVPLIANGFHEKARKNANLNISMIEQSVEQDRTVISTSSTCSFTLQQEYPHVLGVENQHVVNRIEYVTRFLLKAFMNGYAPSMKPINKKSGVSHALSP